MARGRRALMKQAEATMTKLSIWRPGTSRSRASTARRSSTSALRSRGRAPVDLVALGIRLSSPSDTAQPTRSICTASRHRSTSPPFRRPSVRRAVARLGGRGLRARRVPRRALDQSARPPSGSSSIRRTTSLRWRCWHCATRKVTTIFEAHTLPRTRRERFVLEQVDGVVTNSRALAHDLRASTNVGDPPDPSGESTSAHTTLRRSRRFARRTGPAGRPKIAVYTGKLY